MNRKRVRLAPVLVIMILAVLITAVGAAAAFIAPVRLYAKAGPVTMHANVTITTTLTGSSAGTTCTASAQPSPPPRTMAPSRFTCTGTNGQKVTVPLGSTTATIAFHLAAKPTFPLSSATVQIRHGATVLATLTAPGATAQATGPSRMAGSASLSGLHLAGLLNGRDTLYVQAGAHAYHGLIVRVH